MIIQSFFLSEAALVIQHSFTLTAFPTFILPMQPSVPHGNRDSSVSSLRLLRSSLEPLALTCQSQLWCQMTTTGLDPQEMKVQKPPIKSYPNTANWFWKHLSCHSKSYTQIFAFCVHPLQRAALKLPVIHLPTALHMCQGSCITVCDYYHKLPHYKDLDPVGSSCKSPWSKRVGLTWSGNTEHQDYI